MSLEKDILNLGSDYLDSKKEEEPKTFQEQVQELEKVPEYKSDLKKLYEEFTPDAPEITTDEFLSGMDNSKNITEVKPKQKRIFLKYQWKF